MNDIKTKRPKNTISKFSRFSPKQRSVFMWWANPRYRKFDGIICDGAVRSGKTICMSMSFVMWAMAEFKNENFGLCGKTIISLRRNMVTPLISDLEQLGFVCKENISKNYIDIFLGNSHNRFYLFGGKDESSASLIQGVTLAGIMLDETVLMPRSFVEQAVARCSVNGSKLWFNCNPENPYHWFKKEWIDKHKEKNLLYMHFDLKDNPSLSDEVLKRYSRLYTGAFYDRFVLGKWTVAEGLVYPMFDLKKHTYKGDIPCESYVVSCDYGTVNPSSFGLWGKYKDKWYRVDEYYYDSRREGKRLTDEEHYDGLCRLVCGRKIDRIIVDPSAASFIQCIEKHGVYKVQPAKNDVVWGIRIVSDYIRNGRLMINENCKDTLREFALYRWDKNSQKDCPIKENDHAMDDIRYFVTYIDEKHDEPFMVMSLDRKELYNEDI